MFNSRLLERRPSVPSGLISGIPHNPAPEAGGTIQHAEYGSGVVMTKLEGKGNGMMDLELTSASEKDILENTIASTVTYAAGHGPVDVRVVDPLRVPDANFELRVGSERVKTSIRRTLLTRTGRSPTCRSSATPIPITTTKPFTSRPRPLHSSTKSCCLDWGLSVTVHQYAYPLDGKFTEPVHASITFDDPAQPWLLGIPDAEGFNQLNWIRAGNQEGAQRRAFGSHLQRLEDGQPPRRGRSVRGHPRRHLGSLLPRALTQVSVELPNGEVVKLPNIAPTIDWLEGDLSPFSGISGLNNVDVVLTRTTGLVDALPRLGDAVGRRTRPQRTVGCGKLGLRRHPSVDKNGRYERADRATTAVRPTPTELNLSAWAGSRDTPSTVATGERLNMAFGEDSWLGAENGKDMLWNPSSNIYGGVGGGGGFGGSAIYAGGQHWIYVFKNSQYEEGMKTACRRTTVETTSGPTSRPTRLRPHVRRVFRACTWVGSSLLNEDFAMLSPEDGLIPNDVRVRLRVAKAYEKYSSATLDADNYDVAENYNWNPLYTILHGRRRYADRRNPVLRAMLDRNQRACPTRTTHSASTRPASSTTASRSPTCLRCAPCASTTCRNPRAVVLQSRPPHILGLGPQERTQRPHRGGVYIIHIDVPNVGEKTLKWFGIMRPTDLDNF